MKKYRGTLRSSKKEDFAFECDHTKELILYAHSTAIFRSPGIQWNSVEFQLFQEQFFQDAVQMVIMTLANLSGAGFMIRVLLQLAKNCNFRRSISFFSRN